MFDDGVVYANTGAKSFECLVLQLAMQESCLSHCKFKEDEKNPFYCDGDDDKVMRSGVEGEDSRGVMQLNSRYFDEPVLKYSR